MCKLGNVIYIDARSRRQGEFAQDVTVNCLVRLAGLHLMRDGHCLEQREDWVVTDLVLKMPLASVGEKSKPVSTMQLTNQVSRCLDWLEDTIVGPNKSLARYGERAVL